MKSLISSYFRRLGNVSCKSLSSELNPKRMSTVEQISTGTFKTFQDMISFRRKQAQSSVLIGLSHKSGVQELVKLCGDFGPLKKKLVFEPGNSSKNQLLCLVEYESADDLHRFLNSSRHLASAITCPVASRLLTFSRQGQKGPTDQNVVEQWHEPNELNLWKLLSACKTMCEEMETIFRHDYMHDLCLRLRFLICVQIEDSLRGLFPQCQVHPFGSSVNGFGSYTSDLDVHLQLENAQTPGSEGLNFQLSSREFANERARTQKMLEVLSEIIRTFFPSVSNVQHILRARVPIIKLHHDLTNIDCDISCSNMTGFYMSELLFLFGELDERVRPLVLAVRKWARCMVVTRETSGVFVTNFSLSLLVIFFLQNQNILPSVQCLEQLAGPEDYREVEGASCTFKRTFADIPRSRNTEDMGHLLIKFLKFYSKFNWEECAVSIVSGCLYTKPDNSAIYIQNPLERSLNITKIVSHTERSRLQDALHRTLYEFETCSDRSDKFFSNLIKSSLGPKKLISSKGLNISVLFEGEDLDHVKEISNVENESWQRMSEPPQEQKRSKAIKKRKMVIDSKQEVAPKPVVAKETRNLKRNQFWKRKHVDVADLWKYV